METSRWPRRGIKASRREVAIGDIRERRRTPFGGGEQSRDVCVRVLLSALHLAQEAELRVGDGGDVKAQSLPLETLAPGDAGQEYLRARAGVEQQTHDRLRAVRIRAHRMEESRV